MSRRAFFEDAFFSVLERTGKLVQSAELAGVTKQAVYYRRDTDPDFRERLETTYKSLRRTNCQAAERRLSRLSSGG